MFRSVLKTFIAAFLLSSCLPALVIAFAAIEWNTQQVLYGRAHVNVSYTLENGVPTLTDGDGQPLLSADERERQGLWALLSPATRAAGALLRGEAALIHRLWTWGQEKAAPFLTEQLSFYRTHTAFV